MDFYQANAHLYELLSKVVHQTQSITVIDVSNDKVTPYPRLEESKFVITEDIQRRNASILTAHYIQEYRPSQLRLERLMRESEKLLIDILIEDMGGIRCLGTEQ